MYSQCWKLILNGELNQNDKVRGGQRISYCRVSFCKSYPLVRKASFTPRPWPEYRFVITRHSNIRRGEMKAIWRQYCRIFDHFCARSSYSDRYFRRVLRCDLSCNVFHVIWRTVLKCRPYNNYRYSRSSGCQTSLDWNVLTRKIPHLL